MRYTVIYTEYVGYGNNTIVCWKRISVKESETVSQALEREDIHSAVIIFEGWSPLEGELSNH